MSLAEYKFLKIANISKLRRIVISNVKKKNSLSLQAYQELTDVLGTSATDESVSVVAITGDGEYYSSGNDLTGFLSAPDPAKALEASRPILRNLIRAFYTFPKLLICVVNGPCIGIAATTAALSDVIYAADTAYFYTPFSNLGLCAEGCASYTFPRILGKSKASEMLMLNHKLPAAEALQFNLVSAVFSKSDIETKLWPQIEAMAELPSKSLQTTKKLMKKFETRELDIACELELEELYKRFQTQDFLDALMRFMERKSKL